MRMGPRLAIVAAALSMAARVGAQTATIPPPEVPNLTFRVAPATSALEPLETAKIKRDTHTYKTLYCYLEGASSPVTFPQNEPLVFVVRIDDSREQIDIFRKEPNRLWPRLELLAVEQGQRYATGKRV